MSKKFITATIVLLISSAFATRSSAIILENWSTNNHSVEPVPTSVTSNMSKNFDISVYDANASTQNFSNVVSTNTSSVSNSHANTNQPNPTNLVSHSKNIWYWLIAILLIVGAGVLFWNIKKEK